MLLWTGRRARQAQHYGKGEAIDCFEALRPDCINGYRTGMADPKHPQKPNTKIITGGRRKALTGAVVNAPVWRASTHLYDDVAALDAGDKTNEDGRFFYGRRGAPTQWSLAEALTELEPGAHGTMLYPSGVAAITGALLSALQPGDVLLMSDNAYDPSRSFAQGFLKRWGVETRFFDPLIGAGISDLFCERTRAILLESPGSLTFEVSDIPAICAAAKAHKGQREIVTLLDNTWATPYFFTALDKGVDMTILAATKYVVGHSDVMAGAVTTTKRHWQALLESRGFPSVAAAGFKAPGVVVSFTTDPGIQSGKKFVEVGLQTASGVPLQCDEGPDFKTFRLGLFGLEKWHNVDRTVGQLATALDAIAAKG